MAQTVGRGDPLEEGMATHSRILPWRIHCTEEPAELQSVGLQSHRGLSYEHTLPHEYAKGQTGILMVSIHSLTFVSTPTTIWNSAGAEFLYKDKSPSSPVVFSGISEGTGVSQGCCESMRNIFRFINPLYIY